MFRKLSKRGMVLILVLPLLSLMAILGTAFVALAHVDMQAASSYVDMARAKGLAVSGVEFATGQLSGQAQRRAFDSPVWGAAAWNLAGADNQWVYRTGTGAGTGVAAGTPLSDPLTGVPTAFPSFRGGVTPYGHTYSLTVGGTYRPEGDYVVLKVIDCQSKLNLNSPHVAGGNPNFANTLQVLLNEVRARPGSVVPAGLTGTAIVNLRGTLPGAVFTSVSELSGLAGTPEALAELNDFLTVAGWRDDDVIEPLPNASFPPGDQSAPMNPRSRRTDAAYAGRYPVNMNVASRPVLVAVLTGIGGYRLRPVTYGQTVLAEPSVALQKEAITPITPAQAQGLADAIIAQREAVGPFTNWAQFESFMSGKLGDVSQEKLVFVNANPNTRCAKFNPDLGASVRHGGAYTTAVSNPDFTIDKFDLNPGTTEFCFSSMGYFEVESLGRVIANTTPPQVMAEAKVRATLRIFDIYRHTTQRDFSNGQLAVQAVPTVNTYPDALWDDPAATSGSIAQGGSRFDGYLELSTEWEPSPPAGATWYINNRRAMNLVTPPGFRSPNDVSSTGPLPNAPTKMEAYGGAALPAGAPYGADNSYATGTSSLWAGSDLANDGILCWSRGSGAGRTVNGISPAYGEHLYYDPTQVLGTLPADTTTTSGTIEFWVKPASTHGSNEVYMAIVSPTTAAPAHREGLVWRLERYGTTLYSIRFYYHKLNAMADVQPADRCPYPDANDHTGVALSDCIGYTYYQQSMDISAWRAGEWHKISHVFPSPDGVGVHGLVSHKTFVDGVAMGSGISWPRDKAHANPTLSTSTETRYTGDWDPGFSGSGVTYTVTVTTSSNSSNLMSLWSLPTAPRMIVGGYLYTNAAATLDQLNAALGANSNRFSNTTIDEIRYYRNNTSPATTPNRFSPGGGTYAGKFTGIPGGGRLGSISYTAYYPRAWNGNANHVAVGGSSVSLSYATSAYPAWVADSGTTAGEGGAVYPAPADAAKRTTGGGLDVHYQLQFTPGGTPTVLSPVVDDVTLTVIRPRVLTWSIVLD